MRPGFHRAPADLLVGPPDPRAVARRLALPRAERRVQPDVRRRAPPRHARRRGRVLLGDDRPAPRRGLGARSAPPGRDTRRAASLVRRHRDDPGCRRRARWRGRDRRSPRRAVADRDLPRRVRRPALDRRPRVCVSRSDGGPGHPARRRHGLRAVPRAHARRLALGHHDHGRPLARARPRLGGALLLPPPHPDDRSAPSSTRASRTSCSAICRAGWEGPFVVGTIAALATGPRSRSRGCSATCAGTTTRPFVVYRLIAAARHPAPDRHRRPRGDVLTEADRRASLDRCGCPAIDVGRRSPARTASSACSFSACSSSRSG